MIPLVHILFVIVFIACLGKVIVYGTGLDVYCCVQTLLRVGLSGSRIVIVEPPTDSQVLC
jgi:hypothetical protein